MLEVRTPFPERLTRFFRKQNPQVRALARMKRARDVAIAIKLAKLTRAVEEDDEQAILLYQQEVAQFTAIVDTATGPLLGLPDGQQPSPSHWQIQEQSALMAPTQNGAPDIPCYGVSTSFLATCHAFLTQHLPDAADQEPEWMMAVTGVRLRETGFRSLEQGIAILMNRQTAARASFDMDAFMRVMRTLDRHGQALHGIFHSHRFKGSPNPSPVDWELQAILDQLGYPAIQAVFSEDAYITFFAKKDFRISISGKGVKTINHEKHRYHLTERTTLPPLSFAGDGG